LEHRILKLTNKSEFNKVFEKPRRVSENLLIILYIDNDSGRARLGMAISKKIIAKATQRNKIKRIIRESFRLTVNLPSVDLIILPTKAVASASNHEVRNTLLRLWNKIKCQIQ
jgi:ribonuclease P protein component